jgi:hypothetical protein
MSQAGIINVAGGGGGGAPIQTLTGDSGGPVPPTANNIFVLGGTSTVNNLNGITVIGNPGTSTETFTLTNRFQANTTTVDGASSTVTILTALAAGTYTLDILVAGFATVGGPAGNGYTIVGAVRSTGAAATLLPNQQKDSFEETVGANAVLGIGVNTITVTVTGVVAFNFDWNITGTYIVAS